MGNEIRNLTTRSLNVLRVVHWLDVHVRLYFSEYNNNNNNNNNNNTSYVIYMKHFLKIHFQIGVMFKGNQ